MGCKECLQSTGVLQKNKWAGSVENVPVNKQKGPKAM